MDARLLTLLAPRPLPHLFRHNLGWIYLCISSGSGHEIDHCIALRRTIQDLIDQGLVHLGHPSVTTNLYHSYFTCSPSIGRAYISWISPSTMIAFTLVDESYEVDGVILDPRHPHHLGGFDHTLSLHFVCYFGHRVPSRPSDNGSPKRCPLTITVALGFGPLDFELSSRTIRAYDSICKESSEDTYSTSEPVLEISHGNDDLFLIGFTFDAIQAMEVEQFCRDHVVSMFFLLGLGLGHCQHGSGEFIAIVDHDTPFSLGFVPTKADYRYMLSDGAPSTSTSVLVTLPFSDHMSLLTLYFPEETNEYGTSAEIADTIDWAILRQYSDEMLMFVHSGLLTTIAYDNDVYKATLLLLDSSLSDQEVSPTIGDSKIVDFGIADQPRELRIELDLSIDESDSLV
ncbi:hypothetical protein AAG906_020939 [Vitis piasezkii]